MECNERDRLSGLNNLAIRAFVDLDQTLCSAAETVRAAEFRRLQAALNEARIEAALSRLELERHEQQHHCGESAN